MHKFTQGDEVVFTRAGHEGTIGIIENWRGGGVAPYVVRIMESSYFYKPGDIAYMPGRDMELRKMQGKKKVWCCHTGCNIYSFESKGTLQWECHRHNDCPAAPADQTISLEEKVDLILAHLKLEVVTEPKTVKLAEIKES